MNNRCGCTLLCFAQCLTLSASAQSVPVLGTLYFMFPNGTAYTGTTHVSVELWIGFSQPATLWTKYFGEIATSDAVATWSNLDSQFVNQPGISLGTPENGGVSDILLGQVHFPPGGIFGNTTNPIHIWSGEWSTPNLTPRTVDLSTMTDVALAYVPPSHLSNIIFPEASAQIQVIPAPSSLAFLALAGGLACRRRR